LVSRLKHGGFHHGEEEEEEEDLIGRYRRPSFKSRGEFDTEAGAGFGSTCAEIQRAGLSPALSLFKLDFF
jgi:hypothetical protein